MIIPDPNIQKSESSSKKISITGKTCQHTDQILNLSNSATHIGQRSPLVAHRQMKKRAKVSFGTYAPCSRYLLQALALKTSTGVVPPSSIANPSKALPRINTPSYTQATACVFLCVGVWPESTKSTHALPTVPTATLFLPVVQHRHMGC